MHCFIQKKSASEVRRILVETYVDNALSDTISRDCLPRYSKIILEDKAIADLLKIYLNHVFKKTIKIVIFKYQEEA